MLRTFLVTLALAVTCLSGCRSTTCNRHPCASPTVVSAAPVAVPAAPCCPTPGGAPGVIPVPH